MFLGSAISKDQSIVVDIRIKSLTAGIDADRASITSAGSSLRVPKQGFFSKLFRPNSGSKEDASAMLEESSLPGSDKCVARAIINPSTIPSQELRCFTCWVPEKSDRSSIILVTTVTN